MAGLQACMRNVFRSSGKYKISNSLPYFDKKIVLHQSKRGRHVLVYQLPIYKIEPGCGRLLRRLDLKQRFVYRLASTNVTTGKTTESPGTVSGVTSGSVKNNETEIPVVSETVGEIDDLPPIPVPESGVEVADYIAAGLKEPSLESLGLASLYKPSGIIQYILQFLHDNMDLPWWAAIATVTFTTRLLLLPLSAKIRRNAVNTRNNAPQLQKLQQEFADARQSGNYFDAAVAAQNLHKFMSEKNIGMGSFVPMLVQIPVFLTVFFGLKGMKEVESLKTGGTLWFTDLTVPDPYYLLPLLSAVTAFGAFQVGFESGKLPMPQQQFFLQCFKIGFPIIIFVCTFRFPTCLVFYWTISNIFTLGLQLVFLIQPVARFFKIPDAINHGPAFMPKKKGFKEGLQESLTNMRVVKELADRERLNTVTFEKAGSGPIQRTFKTNPKASVRTISSNK